MALFEIRHRFTNNVLFACEAVNMKEAVLKSHAEKTNLYGADLRGADLRGVYLGGADLRGADLGEGKKLFGERPFFQLGPIGSRQDYLQAFNTEAGLLIRAGCFFGTEKEFSKKLKETHGDNKHSEEYKATLSLIRKHAKLWGVN